MSTRIRCNNCMYIFEHEEELMLMEDEEGFFHGCSFCETDMHLQDLEEKDEKGVDKL